MSHNKKLTVRHENGSREQSDLIISQFQFTDLNSSFDKRFEKVITI